MEFKGFFASTQLGSRGSNQDSFLLEPEAGLFAIADGIGGGLHGDIASKLSCNLLKDLVMNGMELSSAFQQIQKVVLEQALQITGEYWMGTTLTAVLFTSPTTFKLCHCGDSRCYQLTQTEALLLTEDHEIWDDLAKSPVLSSYIGLSPKVSELTLLQKDCTLNAGDALVICSDGLYKQVPLEDLLALHSAPPTQESLDNLCTKASETPKSDNVTAVWVIP